MNSILVLSLLFVVARAAYVLEEFALIKQVHDRPIRLRNPGAKQERRNPKT